MELDDLKNTWDKATVPAQHQDLTKPEIMVKLHTTKYRGKVRKVVVPEIIGSIVCLAAASFIGINFYKLDSALLQGAGILSILLLLALPIISAISTWKLNIANDVSTPYAETLKAFAIQKIRFVKWQKLNVTLSYLLLVSIIVLMSRLVGGQDLSDNRYFWIFSFTIGYIFLLLYSKWVERYYRTSLQQAEDLLKELAV